MTTTKRQELRKELAQLRFNTATSDGAKLRALTELRKF